MEPIIAEPIIAEPIAEPIAELGIKEKEHALASLLRERIAAGLLRRSITSCSRWAEAYRVMGPPFSGKWSYIHHPWAKDMCDCEAEMIVGQKAAQMAYTEVALNKCFYYIDVKSVSVLYVLPSKTPGASDFSTSRFDPALELSPHLRNLFSDVKNIGHKRAGSASLFIRGSRSRSQLKSIPVSLVICDEVDEMVAANLSLIFERMSGQESKQCFLLSTPTVENAGINTYFEPSSQNHFMFKCPGCSRWTELKYPECLVIQGDNIGDPRVDESYYQCKECHVRLPHETKVEWLSLANKRVQWVPTFTNRNSVGWYIPQLYSMAVGGRPGEMAKSVMRSETDPAEEQEFFNSKLGLPHVVKDAKINVTHLKECVGTYVELSSSPEGAFITMGVDVGKWIHYEIDQYFIENDMLLNTADVNVAAKCRIIKEGKVATFEELDVLMRQYRVLMCVVDANPERRKALEFCSRWFGHAKMCFYGQGITSKQIQMHSDEECTFSVDRTSWMDTALGRFKSRRIFVPKDLSDEYKKHIMAPARIYKKDKLGNPVGSYITGNEDDHFAHARTYAEIALMIGASLSANQDFVE